MCCVLLCRWHLRCRGSVKANTSILAGNSWKAVKWWEAGSKVPKRIGHIYDSITSWSNLYLAFKKACKHKKSKSETTEWMYNCEKYLFELQTELKALGRGFPNPLSQDKEYSRGDCGYKPQPYKYFVIREPKERIISVAAFRDRVVHHALVNIIEPYFEAAFIKDSYATRKEKGLHLAVQAAQNYTCKYQWYLKLDIEKFFASVNHEILLSLINRKIKDPAVMSLCRIILSNQTVSMGLGKNNGLQMGSRGLPVGNLTSQFFANIYLNKLDHFVKQTLGYQAYVRYMDDFIMFSDNPQELKHALKQIELFVQQQLDLRIKPQSVQINRVSHGIPYLGYRIFPKLLRIRRENLKRCLKGIEKTEQAYIKGKISAEVLYQSTRSRMGFIGYARSTQLLQSIWGRNQQAGLTV